MAGTENYIERKVTVKNRLGMHARPAGELVKMLSGFDAEITLERVDGAGSAECSSILSVLMLAAVKGTELLLKAEGGDAVRAADAAVRFFESGFGED